MKYYPINIDIRDQKIIVIGGGEVAHQKIVGLLEAGGVVSVISPQFSNQVLKLSDERKISLFKRKYQKGDLEGAFLVFGATNNSEINRQIHEEAEEKGILYNAVDQPDECDFIVPSRISRGDLLVTISTAGTAPFLSKAIRKQLELTFGLEYGEYIEWFGKLRKILIENKRKEELIPFFERFGEEILLAIQKKDFLFIGRILEEQFGIEISSKLGGFLRQ